MAMTTVYGWMVWIVNSKVDTCLLILLITTLITYSAHASGHTCAFNSNISIILKYEKIKYIYKK